MRRIVEGRFAAFSAGKQQAIKNEVWAASLRFSFFRKMIALSGTDGSSYGNPRKNPPDARIEQMVAGGYGGKAGNVGRRVCQNRTGRNAVEYPTFGAVGSDFQNRYVGLAQIERRRDGVSD